MVVAGHLGITAKENREIRETEIAVLSFGAYLNWEVSKRYRIPRSFQLIMLAIKIDFV